MNTATPDDTVSLKFTEVTKGFPFVDDDALRAALGRALDGGDATQQLFDQLNATGTFWAAIADKSLSFAPGVSPEGTPVVMASSGNVQMRIIATYSGVTGLGEPFGTLAVELANGATRIQQIMVYHIWLTALPAGPAGQPLFDGLLRGIYAAFSLMIQTLAATLAQAASVRDPRINPADTVVAVLAAMSSKSVSLQGTLAEWGLSKLIVDFDDIAFSVFVTAPLIAIPMLFGYLAHAMYTSVMVVNRTDLDFTLSVEKQVWGEASVDWPITRLAARSDSPIPVGSAAKLAQMAVAQYINTNTMGSIGLVLATSRDGGASAAEVIAVPWAGVNTIWTGRPGATPDETYDDHAVTNDRLAYSADFDGFTVKMAISRLTGATGGAYWYGVLIAIVPRA